MWRSTIFFSEPALLFHFRKTEVVTDQGPQQAPAYSKANIVHADFQVEIRFHNPYRAMLIHELVDVCQNYTALTRSPTRWVGEEIADYVRHKYLEKDLLAKLESDSDGT